MKRFAAASLLFALVGCGPVEREYHVMVRNDSPLDVTVVLTKDGPPTEAHWLQPEIFAAMRRPPEGMKFEYGIVPAGKSGDQTQKGHFETDSRAILRVYRGKQTLDTILGIGPDSSDRTDLPLTPGANSVLINSAGKAVVQ